MPKFRTRRALRHVVFGVSAGGGDAPALAADGANVRRRRGNIVLEVDAVLLVVGEWLAPPPHHRRVVLLVGVEQRPHVLADLQPPILILIWPQHRPTRTDQRATSSRRDVL